MPSPHRVGNQLQSFRLGGIFATEPPFGRTVQDRELLPEGEILKDELLASLEDREKGFDGQLEQSNHGQQGCLGWLKYSSISTRMN